MSERDTCTLWVCVDCLMSEATGSASDDPDYVPDCEPWSLWSDGDAQRITSGLVWSEHCDDCAYAHGDTSADCECEQVSFSWSRCDGCGSHLGGSRYGYTYHYPSDVTS